MNPPRSVQQNIKKSAEQITKKHVTLSIASSARMFQNVGWNRTKNVTQFKKILKERLKMMFVKKLNPGAPEVPSLGQVPHKACQLVSNKKCERLPVKTCR